MKKYLAILSILMFAATSIFAQGQRMRGTPEQRADRMTSMMSRQIKGLSADQLAKIKDLNLNMAQKMDSIQAISGMDRKTRFDNFRSMGSQRDEQLKTILTSDQYQVWKAKMEEMRKRREQMMNGDGDNGRPEGGPPGGGG
ncbi:MAG: hypothetical protein ACYCOO_07115 [Chitinophagaceae bacterium]